jgi:hypothetical protein
VDGNIYLPFKTREKRNNKIKDKKMRREGGSRREGRILQREWKRLRESFSF